MLLAGEARWSRARALRVKACEAAPRRRVQLSMP